MERRSLPRNSRRISLEVRVEWSSVTIGLGGRKRIVAKKKEIGVKVPKVVEEIAQIIERGLARFTPEERNARLDKIHLILAGGAKSRRGTSVKPRRTRATPRPSRRRAARS